MAGKLNDRATFQRATEQNDQYGNVQIGWTDLLTVWADVLETPGREGLAVGRIEASRTATMRIRRSAQSLGITPADRVICRGETWNVRSIGNVSRSREMLELVIETGVAT